MICHATKIERRDYPEMFSESLIQDCLTLKVLLNLPLRETAELAASLIEMAGLDWPVPNCSTLCRRQARVTVQIRYWRVDRPVTLIIGSTFRGDDECRACKHAASRHRQWREVDIEMDGQTGDLRAVAFISGRHGNRPILPALLAQPLLDERVGSVTVNGTYDTRRCQGAIVDRGADARIATQRNGGLRKRIARQPVSATTSYKQRDAWDGQREAKGRIPRPKLYRSTRELP